MTHDMTDKLQFFVNYFLRRVIRIYWSNIIKYEKYKEKEKVSIDE